MNSGGSRENVFPFGGWDFWDRAAVDACMAKCVASASVVFFMVWTQGEPICQRSEFCRAVNMKDWDFCLANLALVAADELAWFQPKPDRESYPELDQGYSTQQLGCPPFKATVLALGRRKSRCIVRPYELRVYVISTGPFETSVRTQVCRHVHALCTSIEVRTYARAYARA